MEKPTKKKLKQILKLLTVQQKLVHPPVIIEKNLNPKIKNSLSKQGMQILNCQINRIIQHQRISMQDKNKLVQQKDFNQMKKNLKIYGKNRNEYRIQKIIKFGHQEPQPLKHIVKVHEDKFTIAKQHNIKLSQKIDAIIQQQNIISIKKANKQYLQSKLQRPLVKQLRRFNSAHNFGRTQRKENIETIKSKGQSLWTQRTVCFDGYRLSEEKSLEKIKRDKSQRNSVGISSNLNRQRNSFDEWMSLQKQNIQKFGREQVKNKFKSWGLMNRRLKRKAMEYN